MPQLPDASEEVIYRYSGSLEALADAHEIWSEDQSCLLFDDLQDSLTDALNQLDTPENDDTDIEYRMLLLEYVYEHCMTALTIGANEEIYRPCAEAIILFLEEPNTYMAMSTKENGVRVIAWLCTALSGILDKKEDDKSSTVLTTLIARLTGKTFDSTIAHDEDAVVLALYGEGGWLLYGNADEDRIENIIWESGLTPIRVDKTADFKQIPSDFAI